MHRLTRLLGTTRTETAAVYRVATTEPDRTATVTVKRTQLGIRVGLDLGRSSTTVRTVYEAFDSIPAEHFLGTGERRDFVDLRGQIVPIKVWHECDSAKPAPFFLSSRGYGVRFDTTAVGRMAFGKVAEGSHCQLGTAPCEVRSGSSVVQACFKTASLSYEVYPGTPEQVVRAYAASVGRPPLPAPDQFALTKWRDSLGNETELIEDVDRFTGAGIPLGWVIVDNPWEVGGCAGSMAFDPTLFPDPARTIDGLHARGVRVMIWVSPVVRSGCGPDLYPLDRVVGSAEYRTIDLTDPAVVAGFEQRLRNLLTTSAVDGLKVDRGDEIDFELRTVAGGRGAAVHNLYPVLLAQAVKRAVSAARGSTTLPTLYRAGFTGSQRIVTGVWSGDLRGSWNGIENAIRSAQTAGLVGYSTWGSDVGGYTSSRLTADVFVRWSQLGAISPVLEIGGDGPNSTPWQLGGAAMEGLREAAILHYELFPYHYQLAREASRSGISILRPLALHYPADERSWDAEYELLVGTDLLAAPVTAPGTTARVYLPPGSWVDLGTGEALEGPVSLTRATPLDELPLYLRAGAAIPFNLREPDVWRAPWQLNDLFRAGRGAWLVAPGPAGAAGDSADYGSLRAVGVGGQLRIVLGRARRETQVVVLGNRTPSRVTIDGKEVARSASAATLRGARQGWLVARGRVPGVVLKLAPRNGRATVALVYRPSGGGG
jgi:alpha-D-xyloside xylohydrolase